ncbi:hypothetical protein CR163_010250 [Prosthecochloris sp. ZM_2]|uniref:hypothetical protein n=1 Tax=Prosthecochloris sp. ZM_2 TaxID=2045206 RepID=UPI000DF801CD|nr:hypothetical protein [Prosthecochloris sp. ZM_2]RNA65559.1 hypothetical protein CR163_010250 [Prosthecochloris sp. ZM_2]
MDVKKILFLTRNFPPMMTEGSARAWKLAAHFESEGWLPFVVSPAEVTGIEMPESLAGADFPVYYAGKPVEAGELDPGALSRVLHGRPVNRLTALKESVGGLFSADSSGKSWEKHAAELAREVLAANPDIEVLYAQGPPSSPHQLGMELANEHGLLMVLDYIEPYEFDAQYQRQEKIEDRTMLSGHVVIMPSRAMKVYMLKKHFGALSHDDISIIRNGYDPGELSALAPYVGGDAVMRWVLLLERMTRKELAGLFSAYSDLIAEHAELRGALSLSIVGSQRDDAEEQLVKAGLHDLLDDRWYHSREDELDACMQSDVCVIGVGSSAANAMFVPERFFDILGMRKPVFGVLADGVARALVEEGGGDVVTPGERSDMTAALSGLVQRWQNGTLGSMSDELALQYQVPDALRQLRRDIVSRLLLG